MFANLLVATALAIFSASTTSAIPPKMNTRQMNNVVGSQFNSPYKGPNAMGNASNIAQWPWQGALFVQRGTKNTFTCACALLHPRWAITAAHCTYGISTKNISLYFGINNVEHVDGAKSYSIKEVHVYPGYDINQHGSDLALLEIKDTVLLSNVTDVIGITQNNYTQTNAFCFTPGWGLYWPNGTMKLSELRVASSPVLAQNRCTDLYAQFKIKILEDQFCAGVVNVGREACLGDGGGPLVCRRESDDTYVLRGVTSFAHGCALPGVPTVYTKVANYVLWIANITGQDFTATTTQPPVTTREAETTSESTAQPATHSAPGSTLASDLTTSGTFLLNGKKKIAYYLLVSILWHRAML